MSTRDQAIDRFKPRTIRLTAVTAIAVLIFAGWLLSQRFRAARSIEDAKFADSSAQNRLLGTKPIPFAATTVAIALTPEKADFIEWTGETLIRRDGVSGKPIWDASRPEQARDPDHDPVVLIKRLSYFGDDKRPGRLVQPAPDLNGDGTGDVVWAIEGDASIVAISGKDGSLLWMYSDKRDGPTRFGAFDLGMGLQGDPIPSLGQIFADPVAADVDGDRVPDVIAAFAMFGTNRVAVSGDATGRHAISFQRRSRAELVVVAVSGRSGKWLWSYPRGGLSSNLMEGAVGELSILNGRSGSTIAVADQNNWFGLDPATGQPRGSPIRFDFMPIRPMQYADFDGDGDPEIVVIGEANAPDLRLACLSSRMRRSLWSTTIPRTGYLHDPALPRGWPLISDLDADGRPEVVVPHVGILLPEVIYRGVRVLDGATGTRWVAPLAPVTAHLDGLFSIIESPDLDGDGTRDLVAVSTFEGRERNAHDAGYERWIFVDALSGRDGRSFWSWRSEVAALSVMSPPFWWGRGRDGWPWLALVVGGRSSSAITSVPTQIQPPVVCLLELSTGREVHRIQDLSWPAKADLDGDKIDDLWGAASGVLRAVAGERADPRGATVQVAPNSRDPRWARFFPWYDGEPILHPSSFIHHAFPLPWSGSDKDTAQAYSCLAALSLVVFVIPAIILGWARRRRFKSVRILAVLPLAVALPLTAYIHTIELLQSQAATSVGGSIILGFVVASAGGLPILAYFYVTGLTLVRRRVRQLAGWFVLTAVSGLLAGLIWVLIDMPSMASVEHYSWSGWYQPVVPGAYYLGAIVVIAWAVRSLIRLFKRYFARPIVMTLLAEEPPLREL